MFILPAVAILDTKVGSMILSVNHLKANGNNPSIVGKLEMRSIDFVTVTKCIFKGEVELPNVNIVDPCRRIGANANVQN